MCRAFEEIFHEGRQEGRLEGIQEGRLEGIQEGRLEGIQEGMHTGRQEGKLETSTKTAMRLLLKNTMSPDEIAEITDLPLCEVMRLKAQVGV